MPPAELTPVRMPPYEQGPSPCRAGLAVDRFALLPATSLAVAGLVRLLALRWAPAVVPGRVVPVLCRALGMVRLALAWRRGTRP